MRTSTSARSTGAALALTVVLGTAQAAAPSTLPYTGTPDWTDITFSGTSMTLAGDGNSSTLTTADYRGVWFGWGAAYGDTPAGWTPGTPGAGNYLSLTASFSSNAAGWNAYFYDQTHYAQFDFLGYGPTTDCNVVNCYGLTPEAGVRVWYAKDGAPGQLDSTFLALDMTQQHTFEWLLKNGQVAYRVDGQVLYAGDAHATALSSPLLVIGDGSGSTPSGSGSMTLYGALADNAPRANTLDSLVVTTPIPEPGTWALMAAGLGVLGALARRRRSV